MKAIIVEIKTNRKTRISLPNWTASKIDRAIVCVFPGMLPATIYVAPNSPRDFVNPRITPPKIPLYAKGRVIVRNTLNGFDPSVRAAFSSSMGTEVIPVIIPLTNSGKDMIETAITTATGEKTISIFRVLYNMLPMSPCLLRSINSRYPLTTGGSTKGDMTIVFSNVFPIKSRFTNSQPINSPGGNIIIRLSSATFTDKVSAATSTDVIRILCTYVGLW